ncbi:MAG: hypothetical protein LBL30_03150 [Holosporales bacterium]|nr:hypothetical protein [Holosporales bacterium]
MKTDLTASLISRLCHDVASPIGAIKLGLDVAFENKDPDILSAIEGSIKKAIAVINVFRIISAKDSITWQKIKDVMGEYASSRGVHLSLDISALQPHSQLAKGVFMLLAIIVGSSRKQCIFKLYNLAEDQFCLEGTGEFFLSNGDLAGLVSEASEHSSKTALADYFLQYSKDGGLSLSFKETSSARIKLLVSLTSKA